MDGIYQAWFPQPDKVCPRYIESIAEVETQWSVSSHQDVPIACIFLIHRLLISVFNRLASML